MTARDDSGTGSRGEARRRLGDMRRDKSGRSEDMTRAQARADSERERGARRRTDDTTARERLGERIAAKGSDTT